MYKDLYSRFLNAHSDELHFACHSHHYWPDVSREAHIQYWDDSCQYVDQKWEHIFSKKVPRAQELIAKNLGLPAPHQIVFAPNTHELVFRLLSSLDWDKKLRILTTDSEFYSFDRQINRLQELASFEVVKVPTQPFASFESRFSEAIADGPWDLIFLSHVFFNSGFVAPIEKLTSQAPENSIVVIDGYHGFMAVPTDLSPIHDRAFYMAGSYKYAQGGEGGCFLAVPLGTRHRPFYTGWFAELSKLSSKGHEVPYPTDALQYAGSTMDFSAVYRLIATLELFEKKGLTCQQIHSWVLQNQKAFLDGLEKTPHKLLNRESLLMEDPLRHGHFLTFELPSVEITLGLVAELKKQNVWVDSRGTRLRFGFGLYQNPEDIHELIRRIGTTKI